MIVEIPTDLEGKPLYKFLVDNKKALIQQKKIAPKEFYCPTGAVQYYSGKTDGTHKALSLGEIPADANTIRVKVVANTSMYCDSHMDVLLRDSASKSIKERKGLIPHIHDHEWKIGAEIGDVQNIYYEDIPLSQLGINQPGTAQVLVFETDVKREYNEKVFNKYKTGKVRQHSIGLSYIRLELAINDSDYEKEQDFWNKYFDQIINKDLVEEKGYFWVVPEYKLLENSAVLLGSNILTPTLETYAKSTTDAPPPSTHESPGLPVFDFAKALSQTTIIH